MPAVIGLIIQGHDPGLAALACVLCVLAAMTGTRLLAAPASMGNGVKVRVAMAILALAAGLWTSNEIVLLAIRPRINFGFSVPLALLSVVLSFVPASLAAYAARREPARAGTISDGALLICAVALMHVVSLRALKIEVAPTYDTSAAIALVLGLGCALLAARHLTRGAPAAGAGFVALTVLAVHCASAGGRAPGPMTGSAPVPALAIAFGTAGGLIVVILALIETVFAHSFTRHLSATCRRLQEFVDCGVEGIVFERRGRVTDTNQAMQKLANMAENTLVDRPIDTVILGFKRGASVPGQSLDCDLALPDGTCRPVEVTWKNRADGSGRILAIRDNSRERTARAELQRLARFDPLTGLMNRDHFEQVLPTVLAAQRVALLYVDLDRFESVYETYGRRISDESLLLTVRRLHDLAEPGDVLAQLGRDEFALVRALNDKIPDAAALAGRIVAALAEPFDIDGHPVWLGACVGIALYPDHAESAQSLIQQAAAAMRQAKQAGRGTWRYFEPAIDRRRHERRAMEAALRQALAEGKFAVHYQTFFNTETLQPAGCEALLRWNHPERGNVSPAEFIPIAEENGLIVPISHWVLSTACAEAATWPDNVTLAVNLSPTQFAQDGLVEGVAEVLRQTGLPPWRLELEITEGTVMLDTPNVRRMLEALKALGIAIAMDDFGTGYSSLGYLRQFPFDKIKIDRSFLTDSGNNKNSEMLVGSIIGMGKGLGLKITAEGVENNEQLAMLRAHGCTYVQGYLLARPCEPQRLQLTARKPGWLQPIAGQKRLTIVAAAQSV